MVEAWQELSVLVGGCGSIGKRHVRVLRSLGVRDIRACDPVPEQRAAMLAESPQVRMFERYEDGLASAPDTVLIGTPPGMHIPMARQAIAAGCHVLCEKPLTDRVEGISEFEAFVAAQGKKVMVALCFRYHDGLRKARQYLDAGRIGRLVSLRALVGEHLPDVRPDYRNMYLSQVGGAFDLMHEVDLAVWYAGQPVRQVLAASGNYSDIGIKAPDLAEIVVDFGGTLASIHLDFFERPRRRQTELIGTKGVITVEFARWDHCTVSTWETGKGAWEVEELATERDDMFRAEDSEFLQAVAEDRPIACTIAEARKSVEIVARAHAV